MTTNIEPLRSRLEAGGQSHVLAWWDELDEAARQRLRFQAEGLDLDEVARLGQLVQAHVAREESEDDERVPEFAPPELFPLHRGGDLAQRASEARERGEALISEGRVGYLLVAGGQASRLGYDGPKGAFPVGPVSDAPLFAVHAHRLRAAQERYGARAQWYVMTSKANDAATRDFFSTHEHFGLDEDQVFFFSQGMLPALDMQGRVLLAAKDRIFLAPNGHGGTLAAMAESGALEHARDHGIETFSYFQVDNALVRPADSLFLGLHAVQGAEMSSKVVSKRDAGEKVGVIGRVDGKLGCIEYSDLPASLREARDEEDLLEFRAGNIAVHAIQRTFIESLVDGGLQLPFHVARKNIAALDADGNPVKVEGCKFETFIFDALGKTKQSVTLEVDRAREFAPLKNADGEDSPATVRAAICRLHASWCRAAGLELPDADESGLTPVEVDPLVAQDLEEFLARGELAPEVTERGHLYR